MKRNFTDLSGASDWNSNKNGSYFSSIRCKEWVFFLSQTTFIDGFYRSTYTVVCTESQRTHTHTHPICHLFNPCVIVIFILIFIRSVRLFSIDFIHIRLHKYWHDTIDCVWLVGVWLVYFTENKTHIIIYCIVFRRKNWYEKFHAVNICQGIRCGFVVYCWSCYALASSASPTALQILPTIHNSWRNHSI